MHASGFEHLDLKPGNILIAQPSEEVFVVRGHPSLPPVRSCLGRPWSREGPDGDSIGTPAYMAPEQAADGQLGTVTALADVYGLGGILYWLLYGDPPNQVNTLNTRDGLAALARRNGPPPPGRLQFTDPPSQELAKELESVCLRALHSQRVKRPQNVGEFMEAIQKALMH